MLPFVLTFETRSLCSPDRSETPRDHLMHFPSAGLIACSTAPCLLASCFHPNILLSHGHFWKGHSSHLHFGIIHWKLTVNVRV